MQLRQYVLSLRKFRSWHRWLGLALAVFFIISSVTGVLLALKKDIAILQPPTQKGSSKKLNTWMPLSELAELARLEFYKKHPEQANNPIDRIDVRPSKGIAKVIFDQGNWEVQIDGTNGNIKSIAKRHSDWIEALHDGSIVSKGFKLVSMNLLGFGLLFMTASGFWLWYGPRKYRRLKRKN